MFKLYVILVLLSRAYGALLFAKLGDNVTLPCFYHSGAKNLCWYKQVAGEQPEIISSFYKHSRGSNNFYNQFKDNKRFSVHIGERFYHLNISNAQLLDSAMYFCGQTSVAITQFHNGIFLVFKGQVLSGMTQDNGVRTGKVGGNVTLQCCYQHESVTFVFWYQQTLGSKPQLISTRMKHSREAKITPDFKERFGVFTTTEDTNHLTITDLRLSDSATYYCGILEFNSIEFGRGVFLHVTSSLSNIQPVVHPPSLEPLWSGDSVNLSCTVSVKPCVGKQSLYWFRHGASQPAVMYPRAGQCTNISNGQSIIRQCTLSLFIKSVRPADAGTYYCALASCGEIIFGNGTEIKIAGTVSHPTCSAASDTVVGEMNSQAADEVHYAAVSLNRKSKRQHQQDNVESVCVYSRLKTKEQSGTLLVNNSQD
ncbi:hypothetical protein PAMP_015531 [Pampus punctatissimus]